MSRSRFKGSGLEEEMEAWGLSGRVGEDSELMPGVEMPQGLWEKLGLNSCCQLARKVGYEVKYYTELP